MDAFLGEQISIQVRIHRASNKQKLFLSHSMFNRLLIKMKVKSNTMIFFRSNSYYQQGLDPSQPIQANFIHIGPDWLVCANKLVDSKQFQWHDFKPTFLCQNLCPLIAHIFHS